MSRSFPREYRLLTAAQYRRVFRDAVRVSNDHFTVLAVSTGENHSRLGLAIAKKRIRLAVHRNRLKRLVRECFRTWDWPEDALPVDLVVMARESVVDVSNGCLRASLTACLSDIQKALNHKLK